MGGARITHLAKALGVERDEAYRKAYWQVFERFFGAQNSLVVKATLLAKFPRGDEGNSEHDRVCFGLRQTMGWIADAIERSALKESGHPVDDVPSPRAEATR